MTSPSTPPLRVYQGTRERTPQGGLRVHYTDLGADGTEHAPRVLHPGPSQTLFNHSPDGFAWGYGGSGPAQLALALLLDVTGDEALSVRLHQPFKRAVVAVMPDDWTLTAHKVARWVAKWEGTEPPGDSPPRVTRESG